MERLTEKLSKTQYQVTKSALQEMEKGYTGQAIDRLAAFENVYAEVWESQQALPEQLEKLRAAGREKTVQFRELMTKKMTNAMILNLFKTYGIE